MALWPDALPQYVKVREYTERPGPTVIRSETDSGHAKQRPRSTAPVERLNVTMLLDRTQRDVFIDFHRAMLAEGTLPFDWVHPVTRLPTTFRLVGGSYELRAVSALWYELSLSLETLPSRRAGLLLDAASGTVPSWLQFTRSSPAWFFGSNGLLQQAAADMLRREWDPATGRFLGYLIEEGRANDLLHSEDLSRAAWADIGTPTQSADAGTAPDGTATADLLGDDDAALAEGKGQTVAVADDTARRVFSVFVKAGTSSVAVLRMAYSGGTTPKSAAVRYDLTTLGVVNGGADDAWIRDVGGGWRRIALALANNGTGNTSLACEVYPATDETLAAGGIGDLYVWGAQVEIGSIPSSYIPTTTAPASRAADVATVATSAFPFPGHEGTLLAEVTLPAINSTDQYVAQVDDGTTGNRIGMLVSSASAGDERRAVIFAAGAAEADVLGATVAAGAVVRLALAWRANDVAFASNGALVGTDAAAAIPMGLTTLRIGHYVTGTAYLNGHLRLLAHWPWRISDSLLKAMTEVRP